MSILDLKTGKELARLATKRKILHGVAVSPDDAYAFVTVEGIGSEPGTVEIVDLKAMKTVATVDVGEEAAGVDFLRTEPVKRVDVAQTSVCECEQQLQEPLIKSSTRSVGLSLAPVF